MCGRIVSSRDQLDKTQAFPGGIDGRGARLVVRFPLSLLGVKTKNEGQRTVKWAGVK